ncbi:hypothetical protein AB0I60_21965 [Actinosynnema sp. NPDC050436]|uniref:hypothetical protein n=1 Tax=Actinosynnema sp. NPDC050436 TaxID=3155659 RepID=UPI0034073AF3
MRVAALLAAAVVLGPLGLLAAAPARAADCSGVTVVVDFRALGGGVRTGCAPGDPASGLAALGAAGFGFRSASRSAGFVCRIDDLPASDPCVNAAPTDAYWSYWGGTPGGSWTYRDTGAAGHDPAPGDVEGWAFGAGTRPGIAPPAPARPEPPAPRPEPPPGGPVTPVQPPPAQPGRPGTAQPDPTTTGEPAPATGTTTPAATGTTAPSSGSPSAPPSSAGPTSTDPTPVAERTPTSGGTTGLVVGVAVIAVLAGLGLWTARRRRAG